MLSLEIMGIYLYSYTPVSVDSGSVSVMEVAGSWDDEAGSSVTWSTECWPGRGPGTTLKRGRGITAGGWVSAGSSVVRSMIGI